MYWFEKETTTEPDLKTTRRYHSPAPIEDGRTAEITSPPSVQVAVLLATFNYFALSNHVGVPDFSRTPNLHGVKRLCDGQSPFYYTSYLSPLRIQTLYVH